MYLPRKGWRCARNWVTEDVRGSARAVHAHAPHQRVTCFSPTTHLPEGYKTKLPCLGIHSHHFVTNMGPAHSTSFLGEGNLPIILSQAGPCCNRDAHTPQVQHKQTHYWYVPRTFPKKPHEMRIVARPWSHSSPRGVWLTPPFDYPHLH